MFSLYFTHSNRRSFRGIRNSYVCKELFDTFRTIRDVFERDLVNGQTCLFDNSYRALAIHDSFNLSTIDFHSSFLFGSSRARCAEHYICQNVSLVSVEKRLTGFVCTSFDLRIVSIFWDTRNLLCETINLLRETMNLLRETMNLLRETMHTNETSYNDKMTKYLTEMIVWISLLTVKKSNRHILFEAMWLRNVPFTRRKNGFAPYLRSANVSKSGPKLWQMWCEWGKCHIRYRFARGGKCGANVAFTPFAPHLLQFWTRFAHICTAKIWCKSVFFVQCLLESS